PQWTKLQPFRFACCVHWKPRPHPKTVKKRQPGRRRAPFKDLGRKGSTLRETLYGVSAARVCTVSYGYEKRIMISVPLRVLDMPSRRIDDQIRRLSDQAINASAD